MADTLLPNALDHLADSLRSLPSHSSLANLTLLSSLLSDFSEDVEPLLKVVLTNEQDALLSNATWISEHLSELSNLVSRLPASTVAKASHSDLVALVQFDSSKYTIWSWWSPDIWTLLTLFCIALIAKLLFFVGLNQTAIQRTQKALSSKYGYPVETEVARSVLRKYVSSTLGWILNIVMETTCLILQCLAWRLWAITSQPVRIIDIYYIFMVIKLLLITYAADLLIGDHGADVYAHHFFSFLLLFVGQCAFFQTHNPLFFRLATWMLLQATLIIPIYSGLGLIQVQRYLQVQNYKPNEQKSCLRWAYRVLRFTSWIYIPQKVVPAAFCLYWLGRMWNDVKDNAWGRAWLVLASITVSLLLLLQVFIISDSVTAMTNYIKYRAYGGPLPSRKGPIAQFFSRFVGPRRRESVSSDVTAVDLESSGKEKEILDETNSGATTPAISISPSTTTIFEQLPALATYKTPDSPV